MPRSKKPRSQREASAFSVPWYDGYERVSILAWHLGQVTRILPLPLGTESIWPQLGHLR